MPKPKRVKYERYQFSLDECKATINIIESKEKGVGFATAFLNIHLPDGRWLSFEIAKPYRVPLYKDREV